MTVQVTHTAGNNGRAGSSDETVLAPLPSEAGTRPGTASIGLISLPVGDGRHRSRRRSMGVRLLVPISIFVAWWILTVTNVIPPTTLSTPGATWDAFVQLLLHQDLVGDVGVSIRRAVLGLALGAGVGLILGIIVGLTRLGEELLDASMQMLRTVPYPALIFLFIVWFGIGEASHVLLIALATLFPMYLNTANGVRNVDRRVVEAARSFGWTVSTYLGHENGDRTPSRAAAKRYGRAYRVRWEWLLDNEGPPSSGVPVVKIIGKVDGGGKVSLYDADEVKDCGDNPPHVGVATVALEAGASLRGVADSGWLYFFDHEKKPPSQDLIGKLCVVALKDGDILIRVLQPGRRRGRYDLESSTEPTLRDQQIAWAAQVSWIKPR